MYPLHPMIVHFPIALLLAGVVAQIVAVWKRDFFDRMATYLFVSGFVMGVFSYFSGETGEDTAEARFGEQIEPLIEQHQALAVLSMLSFAVVLIFKLLPFLRKMMWSKFAVLIVSLVGAVLLAFTGHLGGQIVYSSPVGTNVENGQAPYQEGQGFGGELFGNGFGEEEEAKEAEEGR